MLEFLINFWNLYFVSLQLILIIIISVALFKSKKKLAIALIYIHFVITGLFNLYAGKKVYETTKGIKSYLYQHERLLMHVETFFKDTDLVFYKFLLSQLII